MDGGGLLSLKWNNHKSTFFYVLSNVRKKECYTDVTLACNGKFYPVHKLVLSTCSEYFEQMFEQTQCKHPVIVLKDIRCEELESLLSYMYVGEVNVVQEKLSGLIKAAECLRIKGLAVPDEEPCNSNSKLSASSGSAREKRTSDNSISSEPKRRRQDDSTGSSTSNYNINRSSRGDDRRKSLDTSSNNKFSSSSSSSNVNSNKDRGDKSPITREKLPLSSPPRSTSTNVQQQQQSAASDVKEEQPPDPPEEQDPHDMTIDEPTEPVKQEPVDLDAVYLSDSNSANDAKDMMMDSYDDGGDGQQHFMDELLGQNSATDQGHMGVGEYTEGAEGSSSAPSGAGGSQQQQHMVRTHCAGANLTSLAFWSDTSTAIAPRDHDEHLLMLLPRASSIGPEPYSRIEEESTMRLSPQEHNNPRPKTKSLCPVCDKSFISKRDLRRHFLVHTGEKPFPCAYCPYRARQISALRSHTNFKHPGHYVEKGSD